MSFESFKALLALQIEEYRVLKLQIRKYNVPKILLKIDIFQPDKRRLLSAKDLEENLS